MFSYVPKIKRTLYGKRSGQKLENSFVSTGHL